MCREPQKFYDRMMKFQLDLLSVVNDMYDDMHGFDDRNDVCPAVAIRVGESMILRSVNTDVLDHLLNYATAFKHLNKLNDAPSEKDLNILLEIPS